MSKITLRTKLESIDFSRTSKRHRISICNYNRRITHVRKRVLDQLTGACDMRIASESRYQTDIAFPVAATLAYGFEALAVTFNPTRASCLLCVVGNQRKFTRLLEVNALCPFLEQIWQGWVLANSLSYFDFIVVLTSMSCRLNEHCSSWSVSRRFYWENVIVWSNWMMMEVQRAGISYPDHLVLLGLIGNLSIFPQ